MKKEYVCIICPVCCRLTVEEKEGDLVVSGNACKRGEQHARNEHLAPRRVLTTTIRLIGGALSRLPVISTRMVPRQQLQECLEELYQIQVKAPVKAGQILIKNLCGTGADIAAARTIPARAEQ